MMSEADGAACAAYDHSCLRQFGCLKLPRNAPERIRACPIPIGGDNENRIVSAMPSKKRTSAAKVRSKPKLNSLRPVDLEPVFLELMSTVMPTWNHPEPDDYITPLAGSVCVPCDGGDECKVVGKISAYSVHLGNASEDGVSWFDVLDSHSADIALYLSLFNASAPSHTDWVESNLEPYSSDLLILDRIRIEPEYRGRGYGLYAAELMIQSFGPSGGLAACIPAPYELLQKYELSSVKDAIRLSREEHIPEWGSPNKVT